VNVMDARLILLAMALMLAGFLAGGIYQGVRAGAGQRDDRDRLYVLNRLTGSVYICPGPKSVVGCDSVKYSD
jgi:hypothetical protein